MKQLIVLVALIFLGVVIFNYMVGGDDSFRSAVSEVFTSTRNELLDIGDNS